MALVNGCDGIGSGWSTNVPTFDHREIAQVLISKLRNNDDEMCELKPWFKGFGGEVNAKADGNYEMKGVIEFD